MHRFFSNIVFVLFFCINAFAQETINVPERSAEQEAAVQTEKLQRELNLNEEQTRKVHEINLRYARERQKSNTRAEAVERIKNKEDDLRKVLTNEQYRHLQNKRSEPSTFRNSNTPTSPQPNTETRRSEQQPTVSTQRRTTGQRVSDENRSAEQPAARPESRQTQPATPARQTPALTPNRVERPDSQRSAPAQRTSTTRPSAPPQPTNQNRR